MRCRDYLVSSPVARSQEENNLRHALDLSHTNGWWQAEISALHVEIQRVESEGIEENLLLETIQIQRDDTNYSNRAEQLHNHRGDGTRIGYKSDCDSRAKDGTRRWRFVHRRKAPHQRLHALVRLIRRLGRL